MADIDFGSLARRARDLEADLEAAKDELFRALLDGTREQSALPEQKVSLGGAES